MIDFFLELDKLKPGFDLINDISGFKPVSPSSVEELKKAMWYTVSLGLKRAIRIVPVSYFAANQFSRVSKEVGFDVEFANSIEEAERMLDGKV
ncbi:MAG: hypothetical protein SVY10_08160 [Thermodesulfobacteriota bacterium]|nr:hypothetical protein [Thermodesulfobacteriota bacterium]